MVPSGVPHLAGGAPTSWTRGASRARLAAVGPGVSGAMESENPFQELLPMSAIVHPERVNPADMVRIVGGTAFTVPANRFLVYTGFGDIGVDTGAVVTNAQLVEGAADIFALAHSSPAANLQLQTERTPSIPLGLVSPAGSVITITTSGTTPRAVTDFFALGYLVGGKTPGVSLP